MPESRRIIYWDACNYLSYINGISDRLPVLEALLDASASDNGAIKIYTSVLSKVEVSFGATEQRRQALDPLVEQAIESLWTDPGATVTVEYHDGVGREASRLMRDVITRGWSLKPLDAIHLATARWLSNVGFVVGEYQTYDTQLFRYKDVIGINVLEPYVIQPNLL